MTNRRCFKILLLITMLYLLSCYSVFASESKVLSIKEILQLAAEKNTDIKALNNELDDAKAGLRVVQRENFPSVSLETTVEQFDAYASKQKKADYNIIPMMKVNFTFGNSKFDLKFLNENYSNDSFNNIDPFEPTYEVGYSYDLLRKTSFIHNNDIEIAKLRVEQGESNYLKELSNVFNSVLETYFDALKASNKKNQNLQKSELLKQHLELTKIKYKQGNATEIDILEMENALNNASLDAEKAQNEFDALKSLLCLQIGLDSTKSYKFDEPADVTLPIMNPEIVLENNVRVRSTELDTAISNKLLENQKKNSTTEFVFTANKKRYDGSYSFGLSLKKALTEDYAWEQALERAVNAKQLAQEREKLEVEKTSIEYKTLLNENDILKRKLAINASIVGQLEQKLKLVREQYRLGGVAELKVIETIDALETAKINYQDCHYDYLRSNLALLIFVNPDLKTLLAVL